MGSVVNYSLADLVLVTGAKRRSVQVWAEGGVIRADRATERAGTGRHRQFGRHEAIIACVIHEFARRQMAIWHLLKISAKLRGSFGKGYTSSKSNAPFWER